MLLLFFELRSRAKQLHRSSKSSNGKFWFNLYALTVTTKSLPAEKGLSARFTGNGIWQWNGSGWSQLTPDNPAIMAVGE
jgi:hypothetical protein